MLGFLEASFSQYDRRSNVCKSEQLKKSSLCWAFSYYSAFRMGCVNQVRIPNKVSRAMEIREYRGSLLQCIDLGKTDKDSDRKAQKEVQ